MCYEFESRFLRARALEALRRKPKDVEDPKPATPAPSAAPTEPATPTVARDEDTVPA
jgi:hypothetical protein